MWYYLGQRLSNKIVKKSHGAEKRYFSVPFILETIANTYFHGELTGRS